MKKIFFSLFAAALTMYIVSCKDKTPTPQPRLIFKFKFDSTQERLNNLGLPSTIPVGNAAQSPVFHAMSAHFIQIAQDSLSPLTQQVLYKNDEVTTGGSNAIDFSKSIIAKEGEEFFSVPLSSLAPGTYNWLRMSLAYQNYDVKAAYRDSLYNSGAPFSFNGEVASFLGFDTYITAYSLKGEVITVNGNKKQGYGAVKPYNLPIVGTINAITWDAPPAGATTVVNPFAAALGVAPGSCLVVGRFTTPITITGSETKDIKITVSLSTNNSFEWADKNADGLFEPVDGLHGNVRLDSVVDMGIRGMIPIVN